MARLRAATTVDPDGDRAGLQSAAACLGGAVMQVGGRWMFAVCADAAIDPASLGIEVRRLSPMPLVVLGCVIGLCWVDRTGPLYPGQPTTVDAVLDAMRELGAHAKESLYHAKAALTRELPDASLIVRREIEIRLGPALACWLPAEIELLRRSALALRNVPT
jgi:hypothetical protein